MRVQIVDGYNNPWQCDSDSPQVIAAWLADLLPMLQSADARMMPIRLNVWPTGEYSTTEFPATIEKLTVSRLRWLVQRFENWREEDSA